MSKRATPPYRSLTENPKWAKVQCERCGVHFWLEHCKVGIGFRYCTDECRHEPPEVRFWKSVTKDGPMHPKKPELGCCWNSTFTPSNPYPHFKVNGKSIKASRFILEVTLGRPLAEKMEACHSCDNTRCVNFNHLREGTRRSNSQECVDRGRHKAPKGEAHSFAKLTVEKVIEIKKLKGKQELKETMVQFGLKSETTVWNIQNGKTWKHVDVPPDA